MERMEKEKNSYHVLSSGIKRKATFFGYIKVMKKGENGIFEISLWGNYLVQYLITWLIPIMRNLSEISSVNLQQ